MKQNLTNFILEFKQDDPELIKSLVEAIDILFEEPHIDAPRDVMVKQFDNHFTVGDLLQLEKKKKKTIHVNNLDEFDVFDLYIEQTGMRRADGIIHEPMRYVRDISLGKAVISPRDNISIKLSKSDGAQFLKWITHNKFAMMSISKYLHEHPDRVMELPITFYDDAVKHNTMKAEEIEQLLPAPRNIHESI